MNDTVHAVSSGRPPAAIAIVRISGPDALRIAAALAGSLPPPRQAGLRALRDGQGALLDRALVLVFPGPNSATGEELVELHCHGGRAVVTAVEAALNAAGSRAAVAGEFTRRALFHGRLDLAQAQGLADLLEAETEAQRVAALDGAEGRISAVIGGWLDRIAVLAASVEAMLDFADEDDVADDAAALGRVTAGAAALAAEIGDLLAAPAVERLRDGVRVVIAGPPNAGKSTLLNLLIERDAAIVSPIAGTTRDRIEAPVARGGIAYLFVDTAGLTDTEDAVEAIGVERASAAIAGADVLLWLGEETPPRAEALWVQSRCDEAGRTTLLPGRMLLVSRDDPAAIANLWQAIEQRGASPSRDLPSLHLHQRVHCERAAAALMEMPKDPVLVAEQLRTAHRSLTMILGINATEAMLDTLFGRFCIGK